MRWSQLKRQVEQRFAESVRGRVEVWSTRYRGTHDREGRGWITVDGEEVASMCTLSAYAEQHRRAAEALGADPKKAWTDWGGVRGDPAYWQRWYEAEEERKADGVLAQWDFYQALWEYTQSSIAVALGSPNVLVRALAMLDRRLGKRRFLQLRDIESASPLVRRMHALRAQAEGWPTGVAA